MAKGSLPDAHRALVVALEAMRDAHAPELHVYDLWRPDLALPAVWTWFAPGTAERRPDNCTVRQVDRIVVVIGVLPAARIDEDVRGLVDYVQLAREALDPVIYPMTGPGPLDGQTRAAWAAGQQFVVDRMGDATITCAELPVEVTIDRTVIPGP